MSPAAGRQILQAGRGLRKWGKAPAWATRLAAEVCAEAGVRPVPIEWMKEASPQSWGKYWRVPLKIRVHAGIGDTRTGQRILLLHELAHHLNRYQRKGKDHDASFWDAAFGLYVKHRVARLALDREVRYKAGALAGARKHHVPGLRAAASQRRSR